MSRDSVKVDNEILVNPGDIDLLKSWAKDPRKFVIEGLRFTERGFTLSSQQEDGLEEVRKIVSAKVKFSEHKPMNSWEREYSKKIGISIMSGHGTGKDTLASLVILWFLCCFPDSKIPCTAPTDKQLKVVLWSEISKWIRDSAIEDWLVWQSEKVFLKEYGGRSWFAFSKTVNVKGSADDQAETLAGFHEDYLMIVVDEASGIPNPVFRPLEGTLTGKCNFVFMIFNPTRSTGFAIDSHIKNRKDWALLQWDAEKSERVSSNHVERMEKKYGRDSNAFRIRVNGLPPLSDPDTLIPWDWVMSAVDREIIPAITDPLIAGLDVGGGGDPSILLYRRGGKVIKISQNHSENTMQVTGWAKIQCDEDEVDALFVDIIGLGNGVYNRLREMGLSKTYSVDVRNTARHMARFHKVRDEIWWKLREKFEEGTISIPNDEELIGELTTIKYDTDSSGKIKIEGKKELRHRGLESPNKADALGLTYFMNDLMFRVKEKDPYEVDDDEYSKYKGSGLGWMTA